MVTMVIKELKSVSRLKIFPETGPRKNLKHRKDNGNQGETLNLNSSLAGIPGSPAAIAIF